MDLDEITDKMKNGEALSGQEVLLVVEELDKAKKSLSPDRRKIIVKPELVFKNKAVSGLFSDLLGDKYLEFARSLLRLDRQSLEKLVKSYGTIKDNKFLIDNDLAKQMEEYARNFDSDEAWNRRMDLMGVTEQKERFECVSRLKEFISTGSRSPLVMWPDSDAMWKAFGQMSNYVHLDDLYQQGIDLPPKVGPLFKLVFGLQFNQRKELNYEPRQAL